ncbi:hypothetical protein ANCCEY_07095 [Ancylostoma ceylanicum]|uniref:Uncharacterized protein n=1 Tax=Ancylostoma ceylanicum TaxID=53326 RepID=A0A0D6LP28_9BILA|nr:hypothetical protein ANCCEY_07095 [Ancylostoma ceylanicum]
MTLPAYDPPKVIHFDVLFILASIVRIKFATSDNACREDRLVPPWNENTIVSDLDVQFFFQTIYGVYQGMVQQDHRDEVCRVMTNKTNTPLQNMAYLNERIIEYWQQSPFNGTDNSYADVVEFLKTAQKYGPESATMRLWIWQTCTEFGYYQSTDSGYSIFGSPTPLNFYTRICVDVYGDQYKAAVIEKSIRMMNKLYGGRDKYEVQYTELLLFNVY